MKVLAYSDWKQRIAFDNIIYKDVKRYSLMLNTLEREIMDTEINFYRTHFSIMQVMNGFKFLKTKKDKETFIKAVLKRTDNILYTPYILAPYFKKLIREEFAEYSSFFLLLLQKATEQTSQNQLIDIYKAVFGKYYKSVVKSVAKKSKEKELKIVQKKLHFASYENKARDLIRDLQFDLGLANTFGRSSIRRSVPISVVDEYGYGEWKSKNVSFGNNRFFLYSNHNKLTDKELEYMVNFNVYPGYAHFYQQFDNLDNICFDTGSTFLINGWAMYSACFSKNTAYSNNMLIEGSIIANNLLKKDLEKSYENIWVYLLGKYPKEKAISYMLDYTQYPGHYLSYVMGAFGIKECIRKGFANTPLEFLNNINQINCGDFFAIYSPKQQRKLAKTNITAKVVDKFAR